MDFNNKFNGGNTKSVTSAFAEFKSRKSGLSSSTAASFSSSSNIGNSATASKVKEIIADKLLVELYAVVDNASFVNDLGADSLDVVELIMEFEKEFGISIPDDDAENITTVRDAISYIERRRR